MRLLSTILLGAFMACSFAISAQNDFSDIDFYDAEYVPNIASVNLRSSGSYLSHPVIFLNSRSTLLLEFDDLGDEDHDYIYDIIHCDRNWNPSDLDNIEYLEGFTEEDLENFDFSINTIVDYTHYELEIPNEDIKWIYSGNYLLVIYDKIEDKTPVLTRRFMVVDNRVSVDHVFDKPTDASKYNTHHEIDFTANIEGVELADPRSNIGATILQNYRWDNAIIDVKPRFISNDALVFDHSNVVSFPALKEFRNFDTRTLNTTGFQVHTIDQNQDGYDVLLELQGSRNDNSYHTRLDANGLYVNMTKERPDPMLSAEYVNVIFTVEMAPISETVHILGKFNNYLPTEENRMEYSDEHKSYVAQLDLKQGYYDYLLGAVNVDGNIDYQKLEGSWHETENDYMILIYYNSRYDGYDQLIGYKTLNSNDMHLDKR